MIKFATEQGRRLIILDQGVDYATPEGRALGQMLAVFAEFERELISARVREGLAQRKREGKPVGRRRIATTAVVRRICELRDREQLSFGAIGRQLTAEGALTPEGNRVWQESTARRIYRAASSSGDDSSAGMEMSVALSSGEVK